MIAIGSDHGGYKLKEEVKKYLSELGLEYTDFGTDSEISVDYPDIASKVAVCVQEKNADFGILVCRSGLGMSIVANKYKGIRATPLYDEEAAKYSKMHNNANVIGIGADYVTVNKAINMIRIYLGAEFEQRHMERLRKIAQIEEENMK